MFVKINVKETPPLSRANFIVLIYFHHFIKLEIPIQFFSKIITVRNPVFKQKYFIIFFKFVHVTIKSNHHCTFFICPRLNWNSIFQFDARIQFFFQIFSYTFFFYLNLCKWFFPQPVYFYVKIRLIKWGRQLTGEINNFK